MFSTICVDVIEAVGSVLLLQALAECIPIYKCACVELVTLAKPSLPILMGTNKPPQVYFGLVCC
jgi:hypothetical protein